MRWALPRGSRLHIVRALHSNGLFYIDRLSTRRLRTCEKTWVARVVQEGSESNTDYIGGFVAIAAILIFSNATRRRRSLPTHIHPMGNRKLSHWWSYFNSVLTPLDWANLLGRLKRRLRIALALQLALLLTY